MGKTYKKFERKRHRIKQVFAGDTKHYYQESRVLENISFDLKKANR